MANTWADAVRDYQYFTTARELFTKRRVKAAASEKMTWNLKVKRAQNTVADSFFKADSLNRIDLGLKGEAKWHFQKTHFMVDKREPAMLSGSKTQILDYLKMQESDMYDGFFEFNEDAAWTVPSSANVDGTAGDPQPLGIPYWINQSTTAAFSETGGTTPIAGHETGFTNIGGIPPATYPKWANGTATYASMSNSDFCKKLSEAMNKCRFLPPKPGFGEKVPSNNYQLCSTYKPFQDYEDLLYASNDDIGEDMGKYRGGKPSNETGAHVFRGVRWEWVPALSNVGGGSRDLYEPVYGINWDTFAVKTYGDLFMDRSDPISLDSQHNTVVQWMDTGYQICCSNRRSNFALRAATASST
jgi:hypothetical protein